MEAYHCLLYLLRFRLWMLDWGLHALSFDINSGFFVSFALACYLHRWLQKAKLLHFAFLSVLDAVCILWHIHPTLVLLCNKTSAVKICRLVDHFTLLETN